MFPAAVLAACLGFIFHISDRGFDITDEGFYLLHSQNSGYINQLHLFGVFDQFLYGLFSGQIAWMRFSNAVLLASAGAGFGWSALRAVGIDRSTTSATLGTRIAFSCLCSICVLAYHRLTVLMTPSYNSLALLGLMLSGGSLFLSLSAAANGGRPILRHLGSFAAGAFLVLTLMGKFTSAVALGGMLLLVVLVWPCGWRGRAQTVAGIAAGAVAAASSLFLFVGQVRGLVRNLPAAYDQHSSIGTYDPSTLIRHLGEDLLRVVIDAFSMYGPVWAALGVLFCLYVVRNTREGRDQFLLAAATAPLIYLVSPLSGGSGWKWLDAQPIGYAYGYFFLMAAASGVASTWLGGNAGERDLVPRPSEMATDSGMPLRAAAVCGFALLAPVVQTFGSAASFPQAGLYTVPIVLAAAALLAVVHVRWAPLGLVPIVLIALLLGHQILGLGDNIYRLNAPLSQQTEEYRFGVPPSAIRLDPATKHYFEDIIGSAKSAGFAPGTPVLDFTGGSPGVVYALGGVSPVVPWYPGGYPNSYVYAHKALAKIPAEDLRRAWVLTAPDGEGNNDADRLLAERGRSLARDYQIVAKVFWPERRETHYLWKPCAPDAPDPGSSSSLGLAPQLNLTPAAAPS